jgi:hypothetical protein
MRSDEPFSQGRPVPVTVDIDSGVVAILKASAGRWDRVLMVPDAKANSMQAPALDFTTIRKIRA